MFDSPLDCMDNEGTTDDSIGETVEAAPVIVLGEPGADLTGLNDLVAALLPADSNLDGGFDPNGLLPVGISKGCLEEPASPNAAPGVDDLSP